MTRSILLAATLAVSTAAAPVAFAVERGAIVSPDRKGDEDVASMRRTLVSVLVLQKLQLSPAQKKDLAGVIADMKQLKTERENDPAFQSIKNDRKALLAKAIDEARAKGEVSPETRDALLALRDKGRDAMKAYAGRGKDVMQRLKGILTTDQVESLKDLRGEIGPLMGVGVGVGPGAGGEHVAAEGVKPGVRGGEGRGRGMVLRLLLSDEFQAELSK